MAEEKKSSTVDKLVDEISKLSVLELSGLVAALQDKLGVQAAVPVATAAAPAAVGEAEEEKPATSAATVVLSDAGSNKIGVIKALREINPQLGLKEAKDITDATPREILSNVKTEEANAAKEKLEAAGAKVELK